jgi:hypothetical protein
MLACAFLPFLPLIVDAQIQRLGDDDFAKREAATRFLGRFLQDTDGMSNQWAFITIRDAQKNQSPEIRIRAKDLHDGCKSKYLLGYVRFAVVTKDVTPKEFRGTDKNSFEGLRKEIAYGLDDSDYRYSSMEMGEGGKDGTKYAASFTSSLCTMKKFYHLRNNKTVLMFIPMPEPLHDATVLRELFQTGKGWGIRAPE